MKKYRLALSVIACVVSVTLSAQLKVDSQGFIQANNTLIDGWAGTPSTSYGVFSVTSSKTHPSYNPSMGDPVGLISTNPKIGGYYAYMNFFSGRLNYYVRSDGNVYSKGVLLTSDSICKENIETLPASTLNKIKSLRGVSFNYKEDNEPALLSAEEEIVEVPLGATPEISQQIANEKQRKRIGLVAQEVETVFPEVVRTSFDGTKGILYTDLIGVLIEGIKELQDSLYTQSEQIHALREEMNQLKAMLTSTTPQLPKYGNKGKGILNKGEAVLYQNTPNPFNQETEIAYRISPNTTSASICIYNLNGQQLKKYPLSVDSLTGTVSISASELNPGMYIYSLTIDNQVIDSKRMTLTN